LKLKLKLKLEKITSFLTNKFGFHVAIFTLDFVRFFLSFSGFWFF
jgi:hypothetical protein